MCPLEFLILTSLSLSEIKSAQESWRALEELHRQGKACRPKTSPEPPRRLPVPCPVLFIPPLDTHLPCCSQVRAIGVSNFDTPQLESLVKIAEIGPHVVSSNSDPFSQVRVSQTAGSLWRTRCAQQICADRPCMLAPSLRAEPTDAGALQAARHRISSVQ